MGRPKKYTKKTLEEAVGRYFASISRWVPATEKRDTGRIDAWGHTEFEDVPVYNQLGEQARILEYFIPPTVGGLCEYLGIHRATWAEYCDTAKHPEFSDTTTHARGRMQAYLEQQLLTRKNVRGVIFSLQNNYGYADVRQVELGERAAKAVERATLSLDEKQELLAQIARDFGSGDGDGPDQS